MKVDGDGQIERYKAWLVAQGFTQWRGDDYNKTISPVVHMESVQTVYGLKQSLRCWNSTIDDYLKQLGFLQRSSDPCVYTAAVGEMAVVVKWDLCRKFDVKCLGLLHHFLGIKVIHDEVSGDVWIGQSVYVGKVFERFGIQEAKGMITPVDTSTKLTKAVKDDESFTEGFISLLSAADSDRASEPG